MRQFQSILFAGVFSLLTISNLRAEEIVIYSSDAFPPQVYLADGKPAGFVPALFERLSQDTGDTYRFILLPWKRAISESEAGHGGIVNFSRTGSRQLLFDFSEPLYKNKVELTILKERAAEFSNVNDLKGKIFGIPYGASFGGEFEKGVNDKLYFIDPDAQPASRINKLLLRRIDVAVLGQSYMKYAAQTDPYTRSNQDKLTTLSFTLIDDWEYLAFPKAMHMQPALKRFNKAFSIFKKTRQYQQMVNPQPSRQL